MQLTVCTSALYKLAHNEAESRRVQNLLGADARSRVHTYTHTERPRQSSKLKAAREKLLIKSHSENKGARRRPRVAVRWLARRKRRGRSRASSAAERTRAKRGEAANARGWGRRRGRVSFVSRRNKGISDDKCQACTRSTGSASKERRGRCGDKRGCWKADRPPTYKELCP